MQRRCAEFSDQPVPGEGRDIFDGGIGFLECVKVDVQVFVVDKSDKLVVHDSLETSDAKVISGGRRLDRDFDDVVVPVARGIRAFAENLEVSLLRKVVVPELVRCGEFEFFTEENHLHVLRVYGHLPERIKLQAQLAQPGAPEFIGQTVPGRR